MTRMPSLRRVCSLALTATVITVALGTNYASAGTTHEISRDVGRVCRSLLKSWTFKNPKLSQLPLAHKIDSVHELTDHLRGFAKTADLNSYDQFDWAMFLLLTARDYNDERNWVQSHFSIPAPMLPYLPTEPLELHGSTSKNALAVHPTNPLKPTTNYPRNKDLSIQTLMNVSTQSPENIFQSFKDSLLAMPSFTPVRNKLIGAADLIHDMVFGNTDHTYSSGGSTSEANYGLIQYVANQLENDLTLLEAAIRFYTALRFYDGGVATAITYSPLQTPSVLAWERHQFDVWKLALDVTDNDAVLALRVIAVFGHDDVKQLLPQPKNTALIPHFRLLNSLIPTRQSQLYFPGALPGLDIPEKFRAEIDRLHDDYKKLYSGDDAEADEKYQSRFRAGYYHFIGGINTGTELTRHGYGKVAGFKLPVVLAEQMGYFYKKITMLQTYMSSDARKLYELGFTRLGQSFKAPPDWNENRYQKAKLEVEMSLLYLELGAYQHREGANWAFNQIVKATKNEN